MLVIHSPRVPQGGQERRIGQAWATAAGADDQGVPAFLLQPSPLQTVGFFADYLVPFFPLPFCAFFADDFTVSNGPQAVC